MASPDILTQYNEAAMLAQSYAVIGSICYRADLDQEFTLIALPPSVLANWVQSSQSNVRTARVQYSITAADIINGWAKVHITWPTPFADANYTCDFGINDLDSVIDLSFAEGDIHNKTAAGFDAIAYLQGAILFIQGQLDALDTSSPQSLSFIAPVSTLYTITTYMAGHGGGANTDIWDQQITYTDATGLGQQTASLDTIAGNETGFNYDSVGTFAIWAVAGSTIRVFTTLTNNAFPYDMSVRIVQMPNNSLIPVMGDTYIINAIAIHD